MEDGEDVVIGLARKARGDKGGGSSDDEVSEEKDMAGGRYDKLLDSAADGIIKAVGDGDSTALREELWDFVRACMSKAKGSKE